MTESVLARLRRPAVAEPVRLAVVADPHVSTRAEGTSKLFERTLEHFEAAIEDAGTRDVDAVVSPGDLTKDGEPWNVEAVASALESLDVPFYAVPGNHDVPKSGEDHESPSTRAFAKRFGPGDLPFRVRIGDLDLVGLNSAGSADRLMDAHDGHVDAGQREWLAGEIADVTDPIVLLHHNFPDVSSQVQQGLAAVSTDLDVVAALREPGPLLDILGDGNASLVLTGHYHLPATGVDSGIREIATPTTCSFPQSYLLLDVTHRGTVVRLIPVADARGLEHAHEERVRDSPVSRGLTSVAAAGLASFPLVDEWGA